MTIVVPEVVYLVSFKVTPHIPFAPAWVNVAEYPEMKIALSITGEFMRTIAGFKDPE